MYWGEVGGNFETELASAMPTGQFTSCSNSCHVPHLACPLNYPAQFLHTLANIVWLGQHPWGLGLAWEVQDLHMPKQAPRAFSKTGKTAAEPAAISQCERRGEQQRWCDNAEVVAIQGSRRSKNDLFLSLPWELALFITLTAWFHFNKAPNASGGANQSPMRWLHLFMGS